MKGGRIPLPYTPCTQGNPLKLFLDMHPVSQISPGLNANEIQIPYDKHRKVSSLVRSHQNTHNSVKYEVSLKTG